MPKVSVIIPNYNHAPFLGQRIDSVLQQTFRDIEVIILDDCSSDHSRELIGEYADKDERIRIHFNEENSGSTFVQWNRGASMAKGDYLWIAESDDFASPDLIEKLLPALENDPEVALSYGQTVVVNEEGEELQNYIEHYKFLFKQQYQRWESSFVVDGTAEAENFFLFHNTIPNASAALIRKSTYLEAGGAEPKWKLNGDWMFYVKLLIGKKLAFCADDVNYFRTHPVTQRHRANLTPVVYDEIIQILKYIQHHTHPKKSNVRKAFRIVAGWWSGSLFRQKWNGKNLNHNIRLFFQFLYWKPWLPLSMIATTFFYVLSNLTTWLGIKGKLRAWINRVFPGLLFDPNSKDTTK